MRHKSGFDLRFAPLLVLLLIALAYLPCLRGGFVSDDHSMIEERVSLLERPSSAWQLMSHTFWWGTNSTGNKQDLWRPWISLTYWVEFQLTGTNPFGYHLSNLLVHLANCLLLFVLLRAWLGVARAMLIAGLFGLSAPAVTSVGWISGRTDLWALFFTLVFLITFREQRYTGRVRYAIGAAVSFFLALASKESAIIAPVIGWAMARVESRANQPFSPLPASTKAYMSWLIPLGTYLLLRSLVPGGAPNGTLPQAFVTSFPFLAEQYLRTMGNALVPLHYAFFAELNWSAPGERGLMFSAAWVFLAFLAGLVFQGVSKKTIWGVGGLWFGLALFPAYAIGQSFAPIADFYAYAAMPGFWLLIVTGFERLGAKLSLVSDRIDSMLCYVFGALMIVFAVLTWVRLPILRSETSLWTHMVEREPRSVRALLAVSEPSFVAGNFDQGLAYLDRALKLEPDNSDVNLRLAAFFTLSGEFDKASSYVETLRRIAPHSFAAKVWIARYESAVGQTDKAVATYQQALQIGSPTPDLLFEYGRALLNTGDSETALKVYQAALEQRPNWAEALGNLGLCYENLGVMDLAIQAYEAATAIKPELALAWESLSIARLKTGDYSGAVAAANRFFELNPSPERAERLRGILDTAGKGSQQP